MIWEGYIYIPRPKIVAMLMKYLQVGTCVCPRADGPICWLVLRLMCSIISMLCIFYLNMAVIRVSLWHGILYPAWWSVHIMFMTLESFYHPYEPFMFSNSGYMCKYMYSGLTSSLPQIAAISCYCCVLLITEFWMHCFRDDVVTCTCKCALIIVFLLGQQACMGF